jgi:hypothetical protein
MEATCLLDDFPVSIAILYDFYWSLTVKADAKRVKAEVEVGCQHFSRSVLPSGFHRTRPEVPVVRSVTTNMTAAIRLCSIYTSGHLSPENHSSHGGDGGGSSRKMFRREENGWVERLTEIVKDDERPLSGS